jgi:hypothetical protein
MNAAGPDMFTTVTRHASRLLLALTVLLTSGGASHVALQSRTATAQATAASTKPFAAADGPIARAEPPEPPRHPVWKPPPPPPDPGTLPQTTALPRSDDPAFQSRVQTLWQAIVDDDPASALPVFFPQGAYVQVKAIDNAVGDYRYRLVGYFELDVHAAHEMLGADAARAKLIGADVPTSDAEWMWPGSEENKVSYFRVYGTRVRYQVGGETKSFGIFSLLSWRGQWYVVHFGPWPRWVRVGAVDDPEG